MPLKQRLALTRTTGPWRGRTLFFVYLVIHFTASKNRNFRDDFPLRSGDGRCGGREPCKRGWNPANASLGKSVFLSCWLWSWNKTSPALASSLQYQEVDWCGKFLRGLKKSSSLLPSMLYNSGKDNSCTQTWSGCTSSNCFIFLLDASSRASWPNINHEIHNAKQC